MPTYEYECQACGTTFERFQTITAKPIRRCPECGRGRVRRLISAGGGLLFRGSGFYQTDYRSAEYQARAKAEKEPASAGSGKDSSAKTDARGKHGAKAGK
jgi:putative FmdB family regulatory protein